MARSRPVVLRNPPSEELVSTTYIAERFGVSGETVRNWVHRDGMPVARVGVGARPRLYLSESAVVKWLQQQGMI